MSRVSRPIPAKGISHLASVRIVGNRGYPRRSEPFSSARTVGKVQHNVNLLSYTVKIRKAAAENKSEPFFLASGMCAPQFVPIHITNYLHYHHHRYTNFHFDLLHNHDITFISFVLIEFYSMQFLISLTLSGCN